MDIYLKVKAILSPGKAVSGLAVVKRYGKATELQLMWASNMTSFLTDRKDEHWQNFPSSVILNFSLLLPPFISLFFIILLSYSATVFIESNVTAYHSLQLHLVSFFFFFFFGLSIHSSSIFWDKSENRIVRYQYCYFMFTCRYGRNSRNYRLH